MTAYSTQFIDVSSLTFVKMLLYQVSHAIIMDLPIVELLENLKLNKMRPVDE
jgi:hypothetical protein